MQTGVIAQMMFKTRIRCFLTIASIILVTTICISCCSMLKRQAIEGSWSDPLVSLSNLKYDRSDHQAHALIQCAYQISQTAKLRHSREVWKNTDWQREITERVNVIASGVLLTTVASDGTGMRVLPFEELPDRVVNVPSRSGWVLSFPQLISFASLTNTQTIYSAPVSATISALNLTDHGASVTFCLTQGWKTDCIRLDLEKLDAQVQYTFDASGTQGIRIAPDSVLYIDPDPHLTIFTMEKGTRPQTGTLAIGIDTKSNEPLTVVQPKDITPDAQEYEWALTDNKKILGLKIQHTGNKPDSFRVTETGVPPDFHAVDSNKWNKIMMQEKDELPASVELCIKEHIRKQLQEDPEKNNYYIPLTQ